MSYTAVPRGPETDAVIATLRAAQIVTGDAVRPTGGGYPNNDNTLPFIPYAVVHQGIVAHVDGPVGDPFADSLNEYEVISVGISRASASLIADKAKVALLTTPVTVPGRAVQLVEWVTGRPATRDDDTIAALFYVIDVYALSTSPA